MSVTRNAAVSLRVRDVSGQKTTQVDEVPPDATVGELVERLLEELRLPTMDAEGQPLAYQARYDSEGRHLHAAERVADVVQPGSQLTLLPSLNAG